MGLGLLRVRFDYLCFQYSTFVMCKSYNVVTLVVENNYSSRFFIKYDFPHLFVHDLASKVCFFS